MSESTTRPQVKPCELGLLASHPRQPSHHSPTRQLILIIPISQMQKRWRWLRPPRRPPILKRTAPDDLVCVRADWPRLLTDASSDPTVRAVPAAPRWLPVSTEWRPELVNETCRAWPGGGCSGSGQGGGRGTLGTPHTPARPPARRPRATLSNGFRLPRRWSGPLSRPPHSHRH